MATKVWPIDSWMEGKPEQVKSHRTCKSEADESGDVSAFGFILQTDELQRRVWLHGPDGSTVARFDTRFGMDIHNSVTEQMKGASQCLHCTHRKPTAEDWDMFRDKIWHYFKFDIPVDAVTF